MCGGWEVGSETQTQVTSQTSDQPLKGRGDSLVALTLNLWDTMLSLGG